MNVTPPPLPAHVTAPPAIKLGRTGLMIALLVIGVCITFVLSTNGLRKRAEPLAAIRPNAITNMLARYVVGTRQIMQEAKVWKNTTAGELVRAVTNEAKKPVDKFRAEIVKSAILGVKIDERSVDEHVLGEPALRVDADALREIQRLGVEVPPAVWMPFEKRHGWVARLARAQATDWKEPDATQVRNEARATAITLGGLSVTGFLVLVAGIVLLIKTLRRWRQRGVPKLVQRLDWRLASVLVEAFAIYLFAYTVLLFALHQALPGCPDWVFYLVALLFVVVALVWPRLRGVEKQAWIHALGLHRGAGVLAEMRAGVLGWITGVPLLILAALTAPLISRWTGMDPTHPIVDDLAEPGLARLGIVALAVMWAPVVEETMFRGLLFPGLSALSRWLAGALMSAFVFAVIHPQGWAGVPAIMMIALTMSALRLMRGSLIAPMTAHALNNGLVSVLLVFAM